LKTGVRIPAELVTGCAQMILVKTRDKDTLYYPGEIAAVIFGTEEGDA